MSPEEKAKRDAEFEAKGYVKEYVYHDGKLVESWIDPRDSPIPAPRLFGRDGRPIRPDFSINPFK